MPSGGHVRPTPARVREALFSILGQDLGGWSALDACAGAGLLGVEALSRGAGPVTLCEQDRAVHGHLRKLLAALGEPELRLVRQDARRLLAERPGGSTWDLVLLDPPYADDPEAWLRLAAPATARCLVLEHRWGPQLPDELDGLQLIRHRRYGDTGVAIYERAPAAAS